MACVCPSMRSEQTWWSSFKCTSFPCLSVGQPGHMCLSVNRDVCVCMFVNRDVSVCMFVNCKCMCLSVCQPGGLCLYVCQPGCLCLYVCQLGCLCLSFCPLLVFECSRKPIEKVWNALWPVISQVFCWFQRFLTNLPLPQNFRERREV